MSRNSIDDRFMKLVFSTVKAHRATNNIVNYAAIQAVRGLVECGNANVACDCANRAAMRLAAITKNGW